MNCPDELRISTYVDGELTAAEASDLERHFDACAGCRALSATLRSEAATLRSALENWPLAESPESVPANELTFRPRRIAAALAGALALGWLIARAWSVSPELVPDWLNPLAAEGGINLLFTGGIFFARIGGALMTTTNSWSLAMAGASLLLLSLGGMLSNRGPRLAAHARMMPFALALVMGVGLLSMSAPAAAWDARSGSTVTIGAGETLDETLIATGEVIRIDGRVDGDVLAFARQVTINGVVTGSVIAAAQNVDVNGEVGGTLGGFGQWVRVGANVTGNLYGFGQSVSLLEGGAVGRDALMAGELLEAGGTFGRDLNAAGRKLTLSGRVERNLQMEGDELEMTPSGHVGGSIDATLPSDDRLKVAQGAVVGGATEISHPTAAVRKSRYARSGFYVWGLIKLAGAFVVGALLLWLAPKLFSHRPATAAAGFGRLGIGFLVLVATPVALLLAALTLVGLPLALLGTAAFLAALYVAKILVADWLGRSVIGSDGTRPKVFLALLVGLAILAVAGALPWIGGWLKFAVLLLGLGLLSVRLFAAVRAPA